MAVCISQILWDSTMPLIADVRATISAIETTISEIETITTLSDFISNPTGWWSTHAPEVAALQVRMHDSVYSIVRVRILEW